MNNGGYKMLLNYLSMVSYKRVVKDEYLNYDKFKDYSFLKEKEWEHFINKLCSMKLATKNGNHYTSRVKYKEWRAFAEKHTKQSLKFNGNIEFDMTELYSLKERKDLRELIYFDIRSSVVGSKSISRKWIQDLTGFTPALQRKLEKNSELIIQKLEHFVPVSHEERKGKNKIGNIPITNGYVDMSEMTCYKSKGKKANCRVIQLGNKVYTNTLFTSFRYDKTQYSKQKSKNLSNLNKSSTKNDEIKDFDDYDMLVNECPEGINKSKRGFISNKDKRFKTTSKFKNFEFDKVSLLNKNGELINVREHLNEKK